MLLVLVGGAAAWATTRRQPAADPVPPTQVAATLATMRQTVSATGTIAPQTQANLSFVAAGTVNAVKASVGDVVQTGQPLATVDPTDLQNAVTVAQANVNTAQAQLDQAQASGTASTTQLASATAQLSSAQARLTSARQDLKNAVLASPITGTVAAVNLTVGTRVSASSGGTTVGGVAGGSGGSASASGSSAAAQVVVITTDAWIVNASVGTADLARVKKGLQAEITPTGARDKVFGTVSSVGVIATASGGTATFPVTIAVTGVPTGLYAGGTADVAIVVRAVPDVLTVPTAAIHTEQGRTVVHQVHAGQQVSTPVTIGEVYGNTTQITGGLNEGDQVVVESRTSPSGGVPGSGTRTRGTGGSSGAPGGAPRSAPSGTANGGGQ